MKKFLSFLLVLCLTLSLVLPTALAAEALPFADVDATDWFYDGVAYVTGKGIMTGAGNGSFQPDTVCDRAMFVTTLHRIEGAPAAAGVSFLDVPKEDYYADAVAWARSSDIVKGYGNGCFGPHDSLTREQMALILYRYADYKGYDATPGDLSAFHDAAAVAPYAVEAVSWAVAHGLLTGVGGAQLAPQSAVTRAQVAVLLSRFLPAFEETASAGGSALVLSEFTASHTALVANAENSATFTVRSNRAGHEVALYRDDGVALGTMRDDGLEGDAAADDGVYTCVWSAVDTDEGEHTFFAWSEGVSSRRVAVDLLAGGTVVGKVCRAAAPGMPLSGAWLNVYLDGRLHTCATTGEDGSFTLVLPVGSYHIEVLQDGYIPFHAYAEITADSVTYTETYLMVEGTEGMVGTVVGTITNSLTGTGMDNVLLEARKGWNNTSVGEVLATTYTDAVGHYALSLPAGNCTINAVKDGCVATAVNVIITPQSTGEQGGTLTPTPEAGKYRIVLTWGKVAEGATPRDLDAHLVGPNGDVGRYHVYFNQRSAHDDAGQVICTLDLDNTIGGGDHPETITVTADAAGSYYYYVNQFAGGADIDKSQAKVNVFLGEDHVATYDVPTDQGEGKCWNVFSIQNGVRVTKNTITDTPDVSYTPPEPAAP